MTPGSPSTYSGAWSPGRPGRASHRRCARCSETAALLAPMGALADLRDGLLDGDLKRTVFDAAFDGRSWVVVRGERAAAIRLLPEPALAWRAATLVLAEDHGDGAECMGPSSRLTRRKPSLGCARSRGGCASRRRALPRGGPSEQAVIVDVILRTADVPALLEQGPSLPSALSPPVLPLRLKYAVSERYKQALDASEKRLDRRRSV